MTGMNTTYTATRAEGAVPSELRILIAGAGTGGHLFPGIAVVERLSSLVPGVRARFVTTGRDIENTVLGEHRFETVRISAAGMKGRSMMAKIQSLGLLVKGLFEARRMLKAFAPHLVLGMGGYSSAPVIIAAWRMGIPRVIHEQNRVPGITNRLLGRFSSRVYVSFVDTAIPGAEGRIRFTGIPVRPDIGQRVTAKGEGESPADDLPAGKPLTILVLGGSQGAHSINMAVTGALDYLDGIRDFEFIHQSGGADEAYVRAQYDEKEASATVSGFFRDMASLYEKADLAICRAGAGTIAELAAGGVPAILIPYPHAADDHQTANARGMADTGGAAVLMEPEMTPEKIAALMMQYKSDPKALGQMKANIEKNARGMDAAGRIAEDILSLTGFAPAGQKAGAI